MSPELSAFLAANGTAVVLVGGALAALALVQWRKLRVAEQEHEYRQSLLEKGLVPPAAGGRPVARRVPYWRSFFEWYGARSTWGKIGFFVGVIFLLQTAAGCVMGIVMVCTFARHEANHQPSMYITNTTEVRPPAVPRADAIDGQAFYLDLQPVANQKLSAGIDGDTGHSFAALPQKRQAFGGVPFQVGPGYVRLRGKNHPELTAEAKGVRVGFKFDKLHLLHGTEFGAFGDAAHKFHVPDGTEIGRYRVLYADKGERVIPVVYGEDVRDAWDWDRSRATSRGRVAWTGTNPSATREGVTLRVYLTTWMNPRPDAEVVSIDYASASGTAASPFCIGLTAERIWK